LLVFGTAAADTQAISGKSVARPGLGECRHFDFVAIRTAADRLFMWMARG
jgi:hypothetical protein